MEIKEAIEKCDFMNNALNFQRADSDECSCALQMAISALEKQIPEKPFCDTIYRQISFIAVEKEDIFTCKCNNTVCKEYRYCPFCGQKLDWSDL